jgi:hypothetical protein
MAQGAVDPPPMAEAVLSTRDLNRALLARQMLLAREDATPSQALHRLVALQGQMARAPFVGLWARLATFDPADLRRLIEDRLVVRSTFVRATLHLTTGEDFLALRPILRATLGRDGPLALPGGVKVTPDELEPILALARAHFAQSPRPFESLREVIEAAGHGDVRVMAYAARILLPLVQASDDSEFGFKTGGEFVMAQAWLDRPATKEDPLELVRRYLAAYGPATPADFTAWSGEKGAAALFDKLGGELVRYRDEKKRVLFDLKDAPLPGGDAPAPPRLLPDFDAAVLGHQDRSRIIPPEHAAKGVTSKNLLVPPVVLVDGFVAATWRLDVKKKSALVAIRAFEPIQAMDKAGLEAEALDLLKVFAPGATPSVSFENA